MQQAHAYTSSTKRGRTKIKCSLAPKGRHCEFYFEVKLLVIMR